MFKDNYLKRLYESGKLEFSSGEIAAEIEKSGKYVEYAEWRLGTCAEIEISTLDGMYPVRVEYDYKLACTCPTLERAVGMAGLFVQLIIKLDEQVGWPSRD